MPSDQRSCVRSDRGYPRRSARYDGDGTRAEAQITKEITSPVGPGGADEVVGSIVFAALSGSSSGVLLELDLSDIALQSYTTADIIEVSWSLDPASTAFRSLNLVASSEPLCSPATAPCTNNGTLRLSIWLSNVLYRETRGGCGDTECTEAALGLPLDLGPLDVDSDGVLTGAEGVADDNCPRDANPDETDSDGVPDHVDACLPTAAGEVVNASGCSIADLCPCDNDWKNRGAYVACNFKAASGFVKQGLISKREGVRTALSSVKAQCGEAKLQSVLKRIQAIIRKLHKM